MATYTQSEAEIEVRDALITRTNAPHDWETVSDAVDIYLAQIEKQQASTINRQAIPRETVMDILNAIVQNAEEQNP